MGSPAWLGHSRLVIVWTVLVSAMIKLTLLPGGMTSRDRVPPVILKIVSARALLYQLAGSSEITKVTRPGLSLVLPKIAPWGEAPAMLLPGPFCEPLAASTRKLPCIPASMWEKRWQ